MQGVRYRFIVALTLLCGAAAALAGQAPPASSAGDWPQWRGPDRTGLSRETGLLKAWPAAGPPLVWSATNLGAGFGSVAVKGDRVFVQGATAKDSFVTSLSKADGKTVWRTKVASFGSTGPRATPTVDGDRVYVFTEFGHLACLNARDGAMVWRRNILSEFKSKLPTYYVAESPLVDGDRVYVTPGGPVTGIVALNKKTGKTIWASEGLGPQAAYGSLIVADVQGVRTLMAMTMEGGVGVRASDGKVMWKDAHAATKHGNIATPIFFDGKVLYPYDSGLSLVGLTVQAGVVTAKPIYFSPELQVESGGVLLVNGYLYGFNAVGLICLEAATGKRMWRDRSLGRGSLTYADGRLFLLSEDYKVALAEATPAGYKETGRFTIPESDQPSYAHPVVSGGRLYIRNQSRLFAYDIKAK